jgi:hypothetical protein
MLPLFLASFLMLSTLLSNPYSQIQFRPFLPPSNPINSSNPFSFPMTFTPSIDISYSLPLSNDIYIIE